MHKRNNVNQSSVMGFIQQYLENQATDLTL